MRHTWVFAAVLLTASAAVARDDENRTGFHTHDGFYLRLQLGIGYNQAETVGGDDIAIKGAAGGFNFELGYAIVENFILFGRLGGTSVTSPDIELGGVTVEGTDDDVSSNFSGLGVGATYYFMPVNVYVTGAITASNLSITDDGDELADTDSGPALHLGVGKEWWVSRNWGIGVGGELVLGRIRSEGEDDWNVTSGIVFLSGTFN
jgi:hypothetical protein